MELKLEFGDQSCGVSIFRPKGTKPEKKAADEMCIRDRSEMEPFVTEVEAFASGKHIGLFGSYGWGDGEWMRDWQDRMANAGADVVGGEGVIARESPDEDALNQCRELGEALVAAEA